jgi:hypothetical protein
MTKLRWDRPSGSSPDPGRVIDVGPPLLTTAAGRKRLEEERAGKRRAEARAKRKAAKLKERQRHAAKLYWARAARKAAARRDAILKKFENYNQERLAIKLKRLRSKATKPAVEEKSGIPTGDRGSKSRPLAGGTKHSQIAKGAQLGIALADALGKQNQ